jgi:hypothetical protein
VRIHESALGGRQPEDADDEQDRHGCHRQQAELPVERAQHDDDAEQQHDVADRHDGGFEELLHGVHVALQPAHQAADFGLVHEAQRHLLQVREHGAAHVEQDVFGNAADDQFLKVVGAVVEQDHAGEQTDRPAEDGSIEAAGLHAVVDGEADDQRNGELAQRENQNRGHRDRHLHAVRADESPDAAHDLRVIGLAEDFLFGAVGADDGAGWALALLDFVFLDVRLGHSAASVGVESSLGRTCRS